MWIDISVIGRHTNTQSRNQTTNNSRARNHVHGPFTQQQLPVVAAAVADVEAQLKLARYR